jgi:purine nucleosidase
VRIPRGISSRFELMNHPLTRPGGRPLPLGGREGWGEGARFIGIHGEEKCRASIHEVQPAARHEDPSPCPSPRPTGRGDSRRSVVHPLVFSVSQLNSARSQTELMGRGRDGPSPAPSGNGDGPSPPRLTLRRKAQSITMRSIFLVFCLALSLQAAERPIPVIFDTDIGTDVDDAYALVLAARSPQIDLRAVTTVYGNVSVRSAIARKLLLLMGKDRVPVASGRTNAFDGHMPFWGGWEGKGILAEGEKADGISALPAPELIAKVLLESEEKVVIVSVGGLSNIAAALQKNGSLASKIARFVIMGGSLQPILIESKEIPERFETNLHNDAEAARIVFESGVPITLVPAEVTFRTKLLDPDLDRIRKSSTPLAKAMAAMTAEWEPRLKQFMASFGVGNYYSDGVVMLHDPLAVATLVEPSLVTTEQRRIRVEAAKGNIRTIADTAGPIMVEVVTSADIAKLSSLVAAKVIQ